uniref:DDT domain-containing protein n=1 Tax=Oryza meridionalis TaxID=40149 RepID=A0A0E0CLZ5_9ORYZ
MSSIDERVRGDASLVSTSILGALVLLLRGERWIGGPMPLFKRKPFSLLEPPKDLDSKEKISGKSNLTFEEALVSEHHAVSKAQKLPTELMAPVLRMIQYSTLGLYELVEKIYASLQEAVFEGLELYAKQDGLEAACRILKILGSDGTKMYEVGWLLRDKTIISTSVIKVTWAEYLCDFLEMTKTEELTRNIATVRKGYYSLIDTDIKLKILRELVEEAITTSPVREKLSERVDQRQALAATKRESTRKAKDEQNSSIDGLQDDNESVDEQGKGKEEKDKNNISRSKTEGKRHGVQHLETEIEKLSIRSSPLGKDRHYNRREGRLFVESADSKEWGYYSTKEEFDVLMSSLNVKGIRERALKRQLDKLYSKISNALEKRSKEITHKLLLEEAVLRRSTRVRAQPRDNPSMSFLKYVNKWKDN